MAPFGTPRYPRDLVLLDRWYALRTRSRMEKRAAEFLTVAGIAAEAAFLEIERKWSDRTKLVGRPLFPGYIFARFSLTTIEVALSAPGIVDVVRVERVPLPIRDEEIVAVRRLARGASAAGVEPIQERIDLVRGARVQVLSGPFAGLKGVLLDGGRRSKVAVRIAAIGEARSVHLSPSILALIGGDDEEEAPPLSSAPGSE